MDQEIKEEIIEENNDKSEEELTEEIISGDGYK